MTIEQGMEKRSASGFAAGEKKRGRKACGEQRLFAHITPFILWQHHCSAAKSYFFFLTLCYIPYTFLSLSLFFSCESSIHDPPLYRL